MDGDLNLGERQKSKLKEERDGKGPQAGGLLSGLWLGCFMEPLDPLFPICSVRYPRPRLSVLCPDNVFWEQEAVISGTLLAFPAYLCPSNSGSSTL